MSNCLFVKPLDVIFPRGNSLFGQSGQHGDAQIPLWPSVMSGALRSRMLADAKADIAGFALGKDLTDPLLQGTLGTPAEPGTFRLRQLCLGRQRASDMEPLWSLPADVVAGDNDNSATLSFINPQRLYPGLSCSTATALIPVLRKRKATKSQSGIWLNGAGLAAYLRGEPLFRTTHIVHKSELWKSDFRTGIALDKEKRSAAEGQLYTSEAIAMCDHIGFIADVAGAMDRLPQQGLLRLGGDGRCAQVSACHVNWPQPDYKRIEKEKRFRLVLTTPGIFEQGWRLPGVGENSNRWQGPEGASADLVCASVARANVVSGWDLAQGRPKAAMRAAPAGSVYWFDNFSGDIASLQMLVSEGLGCLSRYPDRTRLAEGFNNVVIANWATVVS